MIVEKDGITYDLENDEVKILAFLDSGWVEVTDTAKAIQEPKKAEKKTT